MGRIKDYLHDLQGLWMNELYKEQKEYRKSKCLSPNNGNDWRRLK